MSATWKGWLKKRGAAYATRVSGAAAARRAGEWQSRSKAHSVASAPPREWPVSTTRALGYSSSSASTARRTRARGGLPEAARSAAPA